MLSTKYRLRLESICKDIASGTEVTLEDMIWANKLAKANTSARGMVSQARRLATDEDGSCLKYLDIGDPKSNKKGFNGADDIADWFKKIDQMIGDNEIDSSSQCKCHDTYTLDFCKYCDILHIEIRLLLSK